MEANDKNYVIDKKSQFRINLRRKKLIKFFQEKRAKNSGKTCNELI